MPFQRDHCQQASAEMDNNHAPNASFTSGMLEAPNLPVPSQVLLLTPHCAFVSLRQEEPAGSAPRACEAGAPGMERVGRGLVGSPLTACLPAHTLRHGPPHCLLPRSSGPFPFLSAACPASQLCLGTFSTCHLFGLFLTTHRPAPVPHHPGDSAERKQRPRREAAVLLGQHSRSGHPCPPVLTPPLSQTSWPAPITGLLRTCAVTLGGVSGVRQGVENDREGEEDGGCLCRQGSKASVQGLEGGRWPT